MKVRVLQKSKNVVKFELSDTTPAFANALRRAMLNKVHVLAVDKVRVNRNDSALYNEVLAHRIGMVPLKYDKDAYNTRESCTCKGEGCAKCTAKIAIKKAGPATVYARDIQAVQGDVEAVDGDIQIVKLAAVQSIDVEADARLGIGAEHARWQPAIVGYQYGTKGKDEEKDQTKITITVESISGLAPQEIVLRAAKVLEEQLEELRKQL